MVRHQPNGKLISSRYKAAKNRVLKDEGRNLTAKEFLDTIDPKGHRSEKSARDYMRRLDKGERSGKFIKRHADEAGGHIVNVPLYDAEGNIVDSANVQIPKDASLLDVYRGRGIRSAINTFMRQRKSPSYSQHAGKSTGYEYRTNSKGLFLYNPKDKRGGIHIIKDRGRDTRRAIVRTRTR